LERLTKEEISILPLFVGLPVEATYIVSDKHKAKLAIDHISEYSEIKKVGFGLKADRVLLSKKFSVDLSGKIDLARLVQRRLELENSIGARNSVAMILRKKLSKMAQMSNWAARPLKPKQIEYASNDAYSALVTYMEFMDLQSDDVRVKKANL